jgi:hypothetical protein
VEGGDDNINLWKNKGKEKGLLGVYLTISEQTMQDVVMVGDVDEG